jgi:hypothetical protein
MVFSQAVREMKNPGQVDLTGGWSFRAYSAPPIQAGRSSGIRRRGAGRPATISALDLEIFR